MVDITHKKNTLRTAKAMAIIKVGSKATIEAIQNKIVPKGDVFEMSRAAGLLGVKKTPQLLPDCHPLPIEYSKFDFKIIEGITETKLALPHLSPSPFIVPWTCLTPALTAARELATARDVVLCGCK